MDSIYQTGIMGRFRTETGLGGPLRNYYLGHKPMLFLHRLLPPDHPSTPLIYVADSASASHGWSLMLSGGLERERAGERERGR